MSARNGEVESLSQDASSGLGVRALVGSGWGFFAVPDLEFGAARDAGRRAAEIAAASALVGRDESTLVPSEAVTGSWASDCAIDPFTVSLADKGDLLVRATTTMQEHGADIAEGQYQIWDTEKWFVSSEGHRIDQHIRESGAGIMSTAIGDARDAAPLLPGGARPVRHPRLGVRRGARPARHTRPGSASESRELLTAPLCPSGETDADPRRRAAGAADPRVGRPRHRARPDPRLGGGVRRDVVARPRPARLAEVRLTADEHHHRPDDPRRARSFGYDDEGTPATKRDAVRDGIWVGVLAGRDSAAVAGLDYGGSVRADGWARLPMVRMTNVGLEPGPHTFDEIIAETDDGIFMETNRSWSIDDRRLNFQFGTEVGYEVKNGKLGRLLRNPTYTGIGPQFWSSMDMLSDETVAWGTPNCGKGQPGQTGHTGHPAAPARFRNVRVGVRA